MNVMEAEAGDWSVLTVGNGNVYGIDSLKVSRLQFTPILKVLFKLLLSILIVQHSMRIQYDITSLL